MKDYQNIIAAIILGISMIICAKIFATEIGYSIGDVGVMIDSHGSQLWTGLENAGESIKEGLESIDLQKED